MFGNICGESDEAAAAAADAASETDGNNDVSDFLFFFPSPPEEFTAWEEMPGRGWRHKAICFDCVSVMLCPTSFSAQEVELRHPRSIERRREISHRVKKFVYLSWSVSVEEGACEESGFD